MSHFTRNPVFFFKISAFPIACGVMLLPIEAIAADKFPHIGGLIQADYAAFRGKPQDGFLDSSALRRADLWVTGDVNEWWNYKLQYRFSNTVGDNMIRNAWIGYTAFKPMRFEIGQFDDAHQGLENSGDQKNNLFIQASAVNELWAPAVGLGVNGLGSFGIFSYQVAAWTPHNKVSSSVGTSQANTLSGRDPWGYSARLTAAPVAYEREVLHVGLSYYSQNLSNNVTSVQLSPIDVRNTPALISDSDNFRRYNVWGLEGASILGPFYAQAEWQVARYKTLVKATNSNDRYHDGGYVQAAYVLTGESREYDKSDGTVGGVKPRSAFGAWEVALRFERLNLRQRSISSSGVGDFYPGFDPAGSGATFVAGPGVLRDWTVGVNFYAHERVKFQLNYSDEKAAFLAPSANKRVRYWAIRGQIDF